MDKNLPAVGAPLERNVRPLIQRLRRYGRELEICNEAAQKIELLTAELEEVLEWNRTERAPLRDQEIASIRRVLAA